MCKIVNLLIIIVFFGSCTKEYSFENPLPTGTVITIGNNCVVSKIIDYDTIVRRNVSAIQVGFNTTGNYPTSIIEFDSLTQQTIFQKSLSLVGDTLRIDATQYFLVDITTDYRIRQFVGRENPYNVNSPIFINNFFYDNTGKLITKQVSNAAQGTIVYNQTDYTYTGNNLTNIKSRIPLNNVTYFEASIAYNVSKQPKNYLSLLPDAIALKPYINTLNFGAKSKNEPIKITVKNFDQLTGAAIDSAVTEFKNYKYSSDGYVLSVDAAGYANPAIPLSNSRNVLQYFCR